MQTVKSLFTLENKMKKILIPLMFSSQAYAQLDIEGFNGCIGKDSTGRDVKVESLVRNLENCSFAKVYLKENEEKYKSELDQKIADALKTSLDQDLELIMLQGEFFNSLGVNLVNYGEQNTIAQSCQLDKMTDISKCQGKNAKEYERRKKILFSKYQAENEVGFTASIKNKFSSMIGDSEDKSCSLLNGKNEQFLLYQASLTKGALLKLKEYVDQGKPIEEMKSEFPMLDLIFRGDGKVANKFINEVKGIQGPELTIVSNKLAEVVKNKIHDFYKKSENAKEIASTMAKSCESFQAKIKSYICSDDLKYESRDSLSSRQLFDGFDMTQSNMARNRRVNLQDKEMAFMGFGKKCEIEERNDQAGNSLDFYIGNSGIFVKDLRENLSADSLKDELDKIQEYASCKVIELKDKNLCSNERKRISSQSLKEVYNCTSDKACEDKVEKTANYLESCERRQAKILAKKNREKETSLASANDSEASAKEVELDFFDNLLGDTKKSNFIASDNKKEIKKSEENADDLKLKEFNAQSEQDRIKGVSISSAGKTTNEESEDYRIDEKNEPNIVRQANPFNETNSMNKFAAEIAEMRKTQALNNTLTAKRPAKSDSAITKPENYVTKENAELRERIAKLEGMSAAQESSTQSAKTGLSIDQRIQALNKENDYLKNRERELLAKNKKAVREVRENTDFRSAVQQTNRQHEEESLGNMEENGRSIASTQSKSATNNGASQAKESKDSKETRTGKGLSLSIFGNTGNELKTKDQAEDKQTNAVLLSAEEIEGLDQGKLDQIWKDKKEKLHLGVKNKDKTIDTVIVAMDNSQKPVIENFASLSQDVQRSILDWKLIKDNKLIVRKNELDQMLKKIK